MLVEQAIFTSARTAAQQGYQLVARSPGLPEGVARFLARWGPSHGALQSDEVHTASLNYLPIDAEWVACSRTVYGGPEYSGRGALQTVTFILLLRRPQLAGYDYHPLALLRTAQLLGHLWLSPPEHADLPAVELPNHLPAAARHQAAPSAARQTILEQSQRILMRERLAWIGFADAPILLEELIDRLPEQQRLDLSFTTGLQLSQHRRFRLHVMPKPDVATYGRLSSQGIRFLAPAL